MNRSGAPAPQGSSPPAAPRSSPLAALSSFPPVAMGTGRSSALLPSCRRPPSAAPAEIQTLAGPQHLPPPRRPISRAAMAVGKNKCISKSKKGGKNKTVDPFAKKDCYNIKAPSVFSVRNVGKTLVSRTQGTKLLVGGLISQNEEGQLRNSLPVTTFHPAPRPQDPSFQDRNYCDITSQLEYGEILGPLNFCFLPCYVQACLLGIRVDTVILQKQQLCNELRRCQVGRWQFVGSKVDKVLKG